VSYRDPALALLFTPLVILLVLVGALSKSISSSDPFQALGRWSYAIYVLHIPISQVARTLSGETTIVYHPAVKVGLMLATVALAALCHRFIEQPLMRLGTGPRVAEPAATD
jgi:peptidoglycan/LPS O-acetylase OafA/YrhL